MVSVSIIELSFFQVPRSSKKLYEDNEYALYTVTLFGRVADNFRIAAREKGVQVSVTQIACTFSDAKYYNNVVLEKCILQRLPCVL